MVGKLRLHPSGNSDHTPRTFKLKASNTGAFTGEEVTLLEVTDITVNAGWNGANWLEWSFTNVNTYTYYRITGPFAGVSSVFLLEVEILEALYTLDASATYYIYVDPPATGTELAADNLILSADASTFDSAKGGWYHPTITDQRAIGWFTTDGIGEVPEVFYLPGQSAPDGGGSGAAIADPSAENDVLMGAPILLKSLLHFNGDDQSTVFTDESGKVWTANGNVKLVSAKKRWGSACAYFDGSGDYIETPVHADFELGADDFHVALSLWPEISGNMRVCGQDNGDSGVSTLRIMIYGGALYMQISKPGFYAGGNSVATIPTNQWTDAVLSRSGNTLNLYINDVVDSTFDCAGFVVPNSSLPFRVGMTADGGPAFRGWIDEFAVFKGSYTPPAREFSGAKSWERKSLAQAKELLAGGGDFLVMQVFS